MSTADDKPVIIEQDPPAGAVIAAVDGSELDALVLTAAAAEALRRGSPLHVRHCREAIDAGLAFGTAGAWVGADIPDDSADVLRVALETLATLDASLTVTADRPAGRPENLLVQASENASLIVVGTGRKSRLEEFLLGAVALNVAAHAACPVLVVPPGSDPDGSGDVVVGVDGSAHSRAALAEGIRVARGRAATLVVVTTWSVEVVNGYVVTEPDSEEWRAVEERIAAMQQDLLDDLDTDGVTVEQRSVKGGIRSTLADFSRGAAVVVVGNRGRGGFRAKALGSVTLDLLKRSTAPVLVVHD